jgi:outer membrane protein OmpA-like peptidoglycan-associated protein
MAPEGEVATLSPVAVKLITLLIATAASSGAFSPDAIAQVPDKRGLFGHLDGRWMWLGEGGVHGASAPMSSGPGGQLLLGYKLEGNWDVALAGDIQTLFTEVTQVRGGILTTDTNHQHIDLEVGFSQRWWRVNVGLRGARFVQGVAYNTQAFTGNDQRQMTGLGPKAGVGAAVPIAENWSLIGDLSGALVYTNFVDTGTGVLRSGGNYWQLVPQVTTEAGVSWQGAGPFSFATGMRLNVAFNTTILSNGGAGTLLEYGPFVRLGYNFNGRSSRLPPPQQPDVPQRAAQSRVVFFDFDGSALSPVALATIRQAAADAGRGRPTNLEIASHAPRAGSAADNIPLSRRRANVVKDELLRHGLRPDQIEISGLGERDPLVPTAGGLQDPKNCAVQITF